MPRTRSPIANPALWFAAALAAAGLLAGCGGGSGSSPVPASTTPVYAGATATPTPALAPTAQATSAAVTTSGGSITLGGIANSGGTSNWLTSVKVTLPALSAAGSVSIALTQAVPTSVPTPYAIVRKRMKLGVANTPLAYVTLTFAQNETFSQAPGFAFVFPQDVNLPYGANSYMVMYASAFPDGWGYASGPVSVSGNNALTFSLLAMPAPMTIAANTPLTFALVSTGAATIASPTPTPVVTPSPVGTGGLSGTQIDHITGLGATFDAAGDMSEVESGATHTYDVVYKPVPQQPWVLTPNLNTTYTYFGYPTVHLETDPTGPSPSPLPSDYTNDKVNLTIGTYPVPAAGSAATSSDDLWEGFDFALDPKTNVPGVDVILAQWWQGTPFDPPVSLVLLANDNYQCAVQIRNNSSGGNPSAPPAYLMPVGSCAPTDANGNTLWHQFMIHVRFGNQNDGLVEVWHNNMTTPVGTWSGNVGYIPGQCVYVNGSSSSGCQGNGATPAPAGSAPTADSKLTAYFGPYRPSDPHTVIMYITNVKFAKDENSANPSTP